MQLSQGFRGEQSWRNELIKEVVELRREIQQLWMRLSQTPQDWVGNIGGGSGNVLLNFGGGNGSGSGRFITAITCSSGSGSGGLLLTYATIRGDFSIS